MASEYNGPVLQAPPAPQSGAQGGADDSAGVYTGPVLSAPPGPNGADPNAAPPGVFERFAHGAAQPFYGVSQGLLKLLPQDKVASLGKGFLDTMGLGRYGDQLNGGGLTPAKFDAMLRDKEARYQAARGKDAGVDLASIGGEGAMFLPMAAEGLVPALATGAAMGASEPVLKDGDYASQKLQQTGMGAAGAGLGYGIFNAAGRALNPAVSEALAFLQKKGVTPTPGQSLGAGAAGAEADLAKIPGVGGMITGAQKRTLGDFNRAAYNEVLSPLGAYYDGPVGHAGVRRIGNIASQAYDELTPQLTFQIDQPLIDHLDAVDKARALMPKSTQKQFDNVIDDVFSAQPPDGGANGAITGKPVRAMDSSLNNAIKRFRRSTKPADQLVADALGDIRGAVMENVERNSPGVADQIRAVNAAWANLAKVESAAKQSPDGVFTPGMLYNADRKSVV